MVLNRLQNSSYLLPIRSLIVKLGKREKKSNTVLPIITCNAIAFSRLELFSLNSLRVLTEERRTLATDAVIKNKMLEIVEMPP